jgi:hypothetical protein
MVRARGPGAHNLQHQYISFFTTVARLYFNVSSIEYEVWGWLMLSDKSYSCCRASKFEFCVDFYRGFSQVGLASSLSKLAGSGIDTNYRVWRGGHGAQEPRLSFGAIARVNAS